MKIQLCGGCGGTHKTTANFGEMLYIIQTKYKQKIAPGPKETKQNYKLSQTQLHSDVTHTHTLLPRISERTEIAL